MAREDFLLNYLSFCEKVEILKIYKSISICRDSKDNLFLSLAKTSQADFLITGDQDLLILNIFENTQIITPKQFLEFEAKLKK